MGYRWTRKIPRHFAYVLQVSIVERMPGIKNLGLSFIVFLFRNSQGAILVYDVTDMDSFDRVSELLFL